VVRAQEKGVKRAAASVPRTVYRRESLAAAAASLGERAQARLGAEGRRWRLEVEAAGRGDAAALLGELLNEALMLELRAARLREAGALAAAVAGRILEGGFPAAPADPLEQLEPQVREDRARETEELLAKARRRA
jgi:hypothetical protein